MLAADRMRVSSDANALEYGETKSPVYVASPRSSANGALRGGPVPNYLSGEVLGLLAQYLAIGLCYGALPNLMYPLFASYFHMTGSQFNSAKTLLGIGWSVKVFVGLLSDCVPLFGFRRKSWMVLGWSFCFLFMVVLAIKDFGPPYYTDRTIIGIPHVNLTEAQRATITLSAPTTGGTISILCGLATISYIIADVPADALVVEVAQREPYEVRGRLQSLVYATRTLATMISSALIGLGLNSADFSGSFDWDMGPHTIFIILSVVSALMVPITVLFVVDLRHPVVVPFRTYINQFWQLVQTRAMWQIMLFNLLFNMLNSGITSTAAPYVMLHWAKVENLHYQLMNVVGNLLFAGTLAAMGGWGTMWNWQLVVVTTTVAANSIDALVQFCTIYDVVRNQWWYLGVPLAENLPYAMQFIVTTFVIVELAEEGNEGVTYGLLTTVTNIPIAVGPVVSNVIFSGFDVSENEIAADSDYTRHQVAYTYIIYYLTTIAACFCVVLLPSQKAALHVIQATGGRHPLVGGSVLALCLGVLLYSIVASLLSMYESTSCYVIAGGKGCSK